jgi:hypothetical protein
MTRITLSIPENIHQYIVDKGLSPSKFLQSKIREEIKKDGLEKQYQINEK